MPRYFITTSDGFQANDEEGTVLPDEAALETMLRKTLARILHDEGGVDGIDEVWAEATDEAGRSVIKLKASLTKLAP